MSNTQREALAVLAEVWGLSPEVRLGQLMAHFGFLGEVHVGKGLGDIEDDELIAVLYRHRAELKARLEGAAADQGRHFHFREFNSTRGGRRRLSHSARPALHTGATFRPMCRR